MGTGYGAAVQWGCMQSGGIGGLRVGQLYMMDGCGAAVHGDWIWGCSTVGLHAGRRYRGAACGAAVQDGRMRGSYT